MCQWSESCTLVNSGLYNLQYCIRIYKEVRLVSDASHKPHTP